MSNVAPRVQELLATSEGLKPDEAGVMIAWFETTAGQAMVGVSPSQLMQSIHERASQLSAEVVGNAASN